MMSTQKLTKYVIFTLTVLIASLLSNYLTELATKNFVEHSYKGVAIEMILIVIIYYPAFILLESIITKISKQYVKNSKKAIKSSSFGLLISFGIALLVLFYLFAKLNHNLDLIKDIQNTLF